MDKNTMLSPKEVRKILNISNGSLIKLINKKHLPQYYIKGLSHSRYKSEDVYNLLKQCEGTSYGR